MSNAQASYPNAPRSTGVNLTLWFPVLAALLIFFLYLGVPTPFGQSTLDASWREVLTYAFAHHFVWGRDIVFTYGPWGFARPDGAFFPDLYWLNYLIQAWVSASFAFFVYVSLGRHKLGSQIILTVMLGFLYCLSWDSYELFYFTVAFYACNSAVPSPRDGLRLTVAIAVLSFLALVKFSSLPLYALWIAFTALNKAQQRSTRIAVFLLVAALVAPVAWWLLAHQPLAAFPAFLTTSTEVARYYNAAMGIVPNQGTEIAGLVFVLLFASACIHAALVGRQLDSLFRLGFYALATALSWKAGFIRADGHTMLFFGSVAISLLLVTFEAQTVADMPVVLRTLSITASFIALVIGSTSAFSALNPMQQFVAAGQELANTTRQHFMALVSPRANFASLTAQSKALSTSQRLPAIQTAVGTGTVDLFAYTQGALLANHLTYSPRPVFQSYSAYSGALQALNAAHFSGASAPEFVMLDWQTIDNRIPTLDDALTMRRILNNYRFVLSEGPYLLLRHDQDTSNTPSQASLHREARRGQVSVPLAIPAPPPGHAVWLKLSLKKTLLGKLYSMVFRVPIVQARITTRLGHQQSYRLIPSEAEAGSLVSPIYRDNNDILSMYADIPLPAVQTMEITPVRTGPFKLFSSDFSYMLRIVALNPKYSAAAKSQLVGASFKQITTERLDTGGQCFLDGVNGQAAASVTRVDVGRRIALSGWAASPRKTTPQSIDILLQNGSETYAISSQTGGSRRDVAEALHSPALANSGYNASGTLDLIPVGTYRVMILEHDAARQTLCDTGKNLSIAEPISHEQ
ncbi:MAG: hypothetical protein ACYCZD_03665 [Rhodanobacter sp.]